MRIWQAGQQAEKFPVSQAGLCELLASITDEDRTRLPKATLRLIRSEVDVLNCALFLLPATGQPWLLGHAEAEGMQDSTPAWSAYVRQHYQRDIALQQVLRSRVANPVCQSTILLHHDADDIIDTAYRTMYNNIGTAQRFGIFRQLKGNNNLLIGIYRSASARAFSRADLNYLELLSACLAEAAVQRYRVMPPSLALSADRLDALQARLETKLSKREYDLILYIARGMTLPAAAKAMGIQPASAVTYRNRGFAKLNIRTQQELFSRLMECSGNTPQLPRISPYPVPELG